MPDPDHRATECQAPSGILDDPPQGPEKFILVISIYVLTHLSRDGHFPLPRETRFSCEAAVCLQQVT